MKIEFKGHVFENDPHGVIAQAAKLTARYKPENDKKYMNKKMLAYFWRQMFLEKSELERVIKGLRKEALETGGATEEIDRAGIEISATLANSQLEAQVKRSKTLTRFMNDIVKNGQKSDYGYCEESGDDIGVQRLQANPIATRTLEEQETAERTAKRYAKDRAPLVV